MHSAKEAIYATTVPALIVAEEGAEALAALEAISLAGGRSLGRVGWRDAVERLDRQSMLGLVVLEAEAVSDEILAHVLPLVGTFAEETGARVVVSLARHQVDLVAAHLFGGHVELLCAPSMADRVAALAIALVPRTGRLHDSRRESDATRLRRMNREVARIAEIIARLNSDEEDEPMAIRTGLKGQSMDRETQPEGDSGPVTARDVREVIRARRLRDQFFERGMFEDPAWDMLLDLFAAELEQTQVSVSSLCIAAAVAPTTALRWIAKMTDAGVFVRHADPFDKRRAFMALSPKAHEGMRDYFMAVKRGGPIA